jgi:UDP-2-acetamido-2,6-beta-L-arabino-hexul-4-ose reductase
MTSRIVITGANGFLGWHTRVVARALKVPEPILVGRDDLVEPERLANLLDGADRVLHLAGVNRGEPDDVRDGNVNLARALADGLRRCGTPPKTVVFANSIQAGNDSPYGESKATAASLLAEATQWSGSSFVDVRLPNLFGEHGRAHYNSVIATFCRVLAEGGTPQVDQDREMELLHATDAAALLLAADPLDSRYPLELVGPAGVPEQPVRRSVRQLADQLQRFATLYRTGEIPELLDRFDVRLFNTYRSHCFPGEFPLHLPRHTDARGNLVEAVKVHGGGGQTFCSGTVPGITRGDHFHLAKVERFVVVRGEAEIWLRRVLHDEVIRFRVSGSEPAIVDMPTMWVHSITNVGDDELVTLFWANDLFDPARPDTYPEKVL